ncbi:phosphodiester glycosidase family protein [Herbivorax sp. ANBcel31]|uniref:phosphodiester glycosidase family protein n=1 Tax=Herbivorax sp. ANBcel31 TaxID=3069754 RepID=UPI0027AF22B7|nr:phosphodiester glycosidase family protein [Herbivorax sp. ANBcel31]MDQ2085135.1 phosphodiester glycosidase family protein [Herbivorax sp. ANBcel31]
MNYIRKKVAMILMLAIVFVSFYSNTNVNANIIYEETTLETITSGVTLENITRFSDEGWQNINVLRVNLTNPNVQIDTLSNKDSLKNLTNTKELVESHEAIAAVNAGFFSWMQESGKASPNGPFVKSGELMSVNHEHNRYSDSMATISLDKKNNVLYDFWKIDMEMIAYNGKSMVVSRYNKSSFNDYEDVTMWCRNWDEYSHGATEEYPDMVEMVIENTLVTDIREGKPPVEIPENGYVVMARGERADFIKNNFIEGSPIFLSISTNPDWENMKMSVGGSAILVKNGKIPSTFSYKIGGRHPRTMAGSSSNGRELLLVTVDGRQQGSLGMTQTESASLMLELGAYNALNLDGGGSTTMAARKPGTQNIEIVNTPSDGSARRVSNAIGVFSVFPPYPLEHLMIDTIEPNVFVNTSREFKAIGIDSYMNPHSISQSDVDWSVSGVEGSFENNVFYPESSGTATITASLGRVETSMEVNVLPSPSELILSSNSLKMNVEQIRSISVIGKDNQGYSARISSKDVDWSLTGDIGELESNTFTAKETGTGYITASVGDAKAHCTISVALETDYVIDSFDKLNGSFESVPETISGSYEITKEIDNESSGKLTYDFDTPDGTRAAYLIFEDEGIELKENTTKIGFWAYNPHENSNWLRGEVIDSRGNKHFIDFAETLEWSGWEYVEASVSGINSPEKLTKIYVVQVNPVTSTGSLYLDDLTLTTATYPVIDEDEIPKDTTPVHEADRSVKLSEEDDFKKFIVFGEKNKADNLLENLLLMNLQEKTEIENNLENNSIETKFLTDYSTYRSYDSNGCRFIELNTSNNSIRTSASGQWQWLLRQLDSFTGENLFIFMENSLDNFNDHLEAELLKDILAEHKNNGKNIWVFFNDSKDSVNMENGIKYIGSAGLNADNLTPDNAHTVKYVEVTIKGNEVTYQVRSLI